MKKIITLLFFPASIAVYAQPKVLTQATVTTKTTIVSPEGDDGPSQANTTTADGNEVRVMRFGGDGETKTITWIKNDLTKNFSESDMGRTTVIRDNTKKLTTTIMEMMGRQTGFYATDEDQKEIRKRMDSMMKGRGGQNVSIAGPGGTPAVYSIAYVDETKKVSGYTCKKALVIGARSSGSDTTVVWYCPDFKIQNLPSTGGITVGLGGFNAGSNGMEDLNGFPIEYERNMRGGRKMTVLVTKLVIDKDVADKEFELPKGVEIKAMKDMQNGGGPGFQIRVGG